MAISENCPLEADCVKVGRSGQVITLKLNEDETKSEFVALRFNIKAVRMAAEKANEINGCGMQDAAKEKKKSGAN